MKLPYDVIPMGQEKTVTQAGKGVVRMGTPAKMRGVVAIGSTGPVRPMVKVKVEPKKSMGEDLDPSEQDATGNYY